MQKSIIVLWLSNFSEKVSFHQSLRSCNLTKAGNLYLDLWIDNKKRWRILISLAPYRTVQTDSVLKRRNIHLFEAPPLYLQHLQIYLRQFLKRIKMTISQLIIQILYPFLYRISIELIPVHILSLLPLRKVLKVRTEMC